MVCVADWRAWKFGKPLNDFWSLDLYTHTWHKISDMNALFNDRQHALLAPNGSMQIVQAKKLINIRFRLAKCWLKVPSLFDLAWGALVEQFPEVLLLSA